MQALLGIIFHVVGGVAAGSFYAPYKSIKKWNWENFWIIGGLFAWLIVPLFLTALTIPGFISIIKNTQLSILLSVFGFGLLWGVGGLTFGLGIRHLGLSLGNTLILGITLLFGALAPSIFYYFFPKENTTDISEMIMSSSGKLVLLGISLSIVGIIICGKAGNMKKKDFEIHKSEKSNEFNLKKGLVFTLISGLLSACFNFGIEAGKPIAQTVVAQNHNSLFQNNISFVILLWGGLLVNLVWCIYLNYRNNSFGKYIDKKLPLGRNYLLCGLAGTIWFLQFFFYGMGESRMGNGASSWILHMTSIILVSNMWGVLLKEWHGVRKATRRTIVLGIMVLILSIIIVGYGNI